MQAIANNSVIMTSGGSSEQSVYIRKRIGSTVYEVRVFFNPDAKETMNDKIMRLIRNESIEERGRNVG